MILTIHPNFQRDIQVPLKFHHFPLPENARLPAKSDEDPQNTMGADLSLGKLNFSKQKKHAVLNLDLLVKFGVGKKFHIVFQKVVFMVISTGNQNAKKNHLRCPAGSDVNDR